MKIQSINNQNFEAKRFRLKVTKLDLTNPELIQYGRQEKRVNLVKEYTNPNAEILYRKAMRTKNVVEKAHLFTKMGDFELYNFGEGILGKIRMNIFLFISKFTDLFY